MKLKTTLMVVKDIENQENITMTYLGCHISICYVSAPFSNIKSDSIILNFCGKKQLAAITGSARNAIFMWIQHYRSVSKKYKFQPAVPVKS